MEEVAGFGQKFRKVWLLTVGDDSLARLMTSNVAKIRYSSTHRGCATLPFLPSINAFSAGQNYEASVAVAAPGFFTANLACSAI